MRVKFHEQVKRSIVKALTFRFLIILSDSTIIYTITHRFDETIGVIFFSNLASTILYFIHERIWNKIHWGKSHNQ